jgi:hypothetical protein
LAHGERTASQQGSGAGSAAGSARLPDSRSTRDPRSRSVARARCPLRVRRAVLRVSLARALGASGAQDSLPKSFRGLDREDFPGGRAAPRLRPGSPGSPRKPTSGFPPRPAGCPPRGCQHRPDLRAVSHPLPRTTRRRAVRAPCRRVTEDSATPAGSLSPSCAYRRADSYRAGAFSESPSSSAYSASTISSSYLTRRAIRARPLLCRQPCMASVIGSKAIHAANATVASTSWRAPAEPSSHEGRAPASRGAFL